MFHRYELSDLAPQMHPATKEGDIQICRMDTLRTVRVPKKTPGTASELLVTDIKPHFELQKFGSGV